MCDDTDDGLLERAKDGDRRALGELLNLHGLPIGKRLDINPKWRPVLEADDVMQVTYLDAAMDIANFGGDEEKFPAWLATVARNNLRDAIAELERHKRPHPDHRVGSSHGADPLTSLWVDLTAGGTTPSGKFARTEMIEILNAELTALPEDYSEVFRLRYFQQLPFDSIAQAMGRTYGAVVLLHYRARERLAERLGSPSRFFSK